MQHNWEASVESLIGTKIGGYKLTTEIGFGPTGQVFTAVDSVESSACIKIIHPGLSLFTRVQSYWEALQKVEQLSHPHITVALAADWSMSGRFYLAMELLQGMDLHQALSAHGRLSPCQVLLMAGQACLALEAAHEIGMVHGGIKPHNIYLLPSADDPGRFSTRLTDFCTGLLLNTANVPSSPPGTPGSPEPAYLAPEQFSGTATKASDIYAMGIVLYEALSGRLPLVGENYEQLYKKHTSVIPDPPANIPDSLAKVVLKALAKDPRERYSTAADLREALEGWASDHPAELEIPLAPLFPKEPGAAGVGSKGVHGAPTVRVPMEDAGDTTDPVPLEDPLGDATERVPKVTVHVPDEEERSDPTERDHKANEIADPTVRVPMEELEAVFDESVEEEIIPSTGKPSSKMKVDMDDKTQSEGEPAKEPETAQSEDSTLSEDEQQLAAIAEQASSMVRKDKQAAAAAPVDKAPAKEEPREPAGELEMEGYFDEDGELVELPLEKSVRAYVATISPSVAAAGQTPSKGNGESLDAALDDFVHQAKAWSAALPPPKVDDKSLAELVKVPVEEPPPPAIIPPPTEAAPAAKSGSFGIALVTFLLGGVLVFGGIKLFGDRLGLTSAQAPQQVTFPDEPDQAKAATEEPETPTKAATEEPETTATASTEESETTATAGADGAAGGEPGDPDAAVAQEAVAAAPDAAVETKAAAKLATTTLKKKRVTRKRARVGRRAKRVKKAIRTSKKRDKPPAKAKPATKKSSDWVDPFSQ